jgi:TIR domain
MTVMEGMTAGPELQKYGGTVFISYARADDAKPPFDKATKGWVTLFWHQLRWELTNAGLPEAKLWSDRYEIEPAEEFTEKIRAALQQARLLVPILSANWMTAP